MNRIFPAFRPFNATALAVKNTRLSRFLNKFINNCQVDKHAVIDPSIRLSHGGAATVIGRNVIIGKNVHIFHNVTIGTLKKYSDKYPVIGDNVIIYPGSIIIGDIVVGQNSIIGAHSFVNKSVPPDSIVYNATTLIIKQKQTDYLDSIDL